MTAPDVSAASLQRELYDDSPTRGEPVFENHPTLLRRYWPRIREKLTALAEKVYGIKPRFDEWKVRVSELRAYRAGRRIFGKVFGTYRPGEKRIQLDASLFPELEHPQRYELQRQGMLVQDAEEAWIHEGGHALQEQSGALGRYFSKAWIFAKWYIEGLNTKAVEYITGRKQAVYSAYQKLAERLINRHGMRKAFRGEVPSEEVLLPGLLQPQPALAYVAFRYAK